MTTPAALFYLAKPRFGGWVTFTQHLAHGLKDYSLYKIGNQTEQHLRDFGGGIKYQNVTLEHASAIAASFPSIITAADKHYGEAAQVLGPLSLTVTHDPTELKNTHAANPHQAVIRTTMLDHLPQASFVRHPYQRCPDLLPTERAGALTLSRVDFDKRTHTIVEACTMGAAIDIYGSENRIYTYHKLNKQFPGWRSHYRGRFPTGDQWAAARLASGYNAMVDLSVIAHDGGGTQYTFLEALDAGTPLILHAAWNPQGELANHARTVADATELVAALKHPPPPVDAANLLREHDAPSIAAQFTELAAAI